MTRGQAEGKDEDDEEPPREIRESLDDGAGPDADEEPQKECRPAEEQAQPNQPHQVAGISARFALASMWSIRTIGTSTHASAVNAVETRTSGV